MNTNTNGERNPMFMDEDAHLMPQGNWINVKTGEVITIKDSFIDDNGMNIITTDGTLIDSDVFSNNYIQASSNLSEYTDNVSNDVTYNEYSDVDYEKLFDGISVQDDQVVAQGMNDNNSANLDIIDKMFSKFTTTPKINCTMKWQKMPIKDISTIINIMDINIDDIVEYIYTKFCDKNTIKNQIYDIISTKLNISNKS